MKKINIEDFAGFYVEKPYIFDLIFSIIIVFIYQIDVGPTYILLDRSMLQNVLSNIIGTCVSLAGFMLAALTIIVTFRSNLKSKKIEESKGPIDFLFSSDQYPKIVSVFKSSIIEFSIIFILLYFFWISSNNISIQYLSLIIFISILTLASSLIRSLLVLFNILSLDK